MKTIKIILLGSIALGALAQQAQTARRASSRVIVGKPGGSFLGVGVAEIDEQRAKALNLKEEHGVEIKSVEDDSPAAKAGLKSGDVVLEYNGQRVEGTEQFIRMVRETPPGRQARMLVWRNGATQTLTATIGSRRPGLVARDFQLEPFEIRIPEIRIPDVPRSTMSWRSTVLGIESESLGSQLAEFFGVKEGVLVRTVTKGSAAEKAGIKAGDVIVKIDDTRITNPREISSILRSARSKKTFPVTVVRNKSETVLTVNLEDNSGLGDRRKALLSSGTRYC
jgi:serine protease Do